MKQQTTTNSTIPTRHKLHGTVESPVPDPDGFELKPNPAGITTVTQLAQGLDGLRRWAGSPSYRRIEERCRPGGPSYATFFNMLKGESLPRLATLVVFVEALGLEDEVEQWANAWRRVAANMSPPAGRRLP